jgi:hypothetical protein
MKMSHAKFWKCYAHDFFLIVWAFYTTVWRNILGKLNCGRGNIVGIAHRDATLRYSSDTTNYSMRLPMFFPHPLFSHCARQYFLEVIVKSSCPSVSIKCCKKKNTLAPTHTITHTHTLTHTTYWHYTHYTLHTLTLHTLTHTPLHTHKHSAYPKFPNS